MMKKTLFKFLLVLTVIFSIGATNIFADSNGVVTVSTLNVRKGPSTKYSRMGNLYKNKSVTILDSKGKNIFDKSVDESKASRADEQIADCAC